MGRPAWSDLQMLVLVLLPAIHSLPHGGSLKEPPPQAFEELLVVNQSLPTPLLLGSKLPPSDPRVRYFGRVDHTNPDTPQFAWVMTGAACTVTGGGSSMVTISGQFTSPKDGARLRVMVNGKLERFVKLAKGGSGKMQTVALAQLQFSSFAPAFKVEVFKITEDNTQKKAKGVMSFGGFVRGHVETFCPRISVNDDSSICSCDADTESGRLCVEHQWRCRNVRPGAAAGNAPARIYRGLGYGRLVIFDQRTV
eukprot:SAG11_NODE_5465_length_1552_cov_1.118376_1_plen_252_part_00